MGCSTMFQALKKVRTRTQLRPFLPQGTKTFHKAVQVEAPSSRAASKISSGTVRKLWVMRKVPRGANRAGSTRAHWVSSRFRASSMRKLGTKVTCRGRTITTSSRKNHSPFPGKSYLANPSPARTDSSTWPPTIPAQRPRVRQNTSRYSGVAKNTLYTGSREKPPAWGNRAPWSTWKKGARITASSSAVSAPERTPTTGERRLVTTGPPPFAAPTERRDPAPGR